MKSKIWLLSVFIIGYILIVANSCNKDDDNDANIVVDIDGNVYHTKIIGTQIWMVENLKTTRLNDGSTIPVVDDDIAWSAMTTPASCTYGNTVNKDTINKYGRLYNWYAVNTGKLCPRGWHVASDNEWRYLEEHLIVYGYNYDGSVTGNKIAKSLASYSGWASSVTEGAPGNPDYPNKKNASGFTALPGGVRDSKQMIFGSIGKYGIWWTSTEYDEKTAWDRGVDYSLSGLRQLNVNKSYGFSVRCVKD